MEKTFNGERIKGGAESTTSYLIGAADYSESCHFLCYIICFFIKLSDPGLYFA